MDNMELWYRHHAKTGDLPDSARKYFSYENGVLKRAGAVLDNDLYENAVGVYADFTTNSFTRIGLAEGLTAGADFDKFRMYGGRRRCNVLDDGTITAFYGDSGYTEDGSNGQVMVYQPAFYYRAQWFELAAPSYNVVLFKAEYWVSEKNLPNFKLHPAFYNEDGEAVPYILMSAYEGSLYDTSAAAYLSNDEQVLNAEEDKLCSIANVKPASGKSQDLTRMNIEQAAKNRGKGWHGLTIKAASMEQLLMLIEFGSFDIQSAIGQGIVSIADSPNTTNNSSLTGSTSSLGNSTGRAAQTINERNGTQYTETANGKTSISYRGVENFWGNLWQSVLGINIWGNGGSGGGNLYICSDFNFQEDKNSDNYVSTGYHISSSSGYISYFGYTSSFDYLFIPTQCNGSSSSGIKDYTSVTQNMSGYKVANIGDYWADGGAAGAFAWHFMYGSTQRARTVGGRLIHVPV